MGKSIKSTHAIQIKHNAPGSKKLSKFNKGKKGKSKGSGTSGKKSYLNLQVSTIACKEKRQKIFFRRKAELKKLKRTTRKKRKEESEQTGVPLEKPKVIEDKMEVDENFVFEETEELQNEENMDEFANYFKNEKKPKILMTTGERPSGKIFDFLKEVKTTFPNCFYYERKANYKLSEIAGYAHNRDYTDIMVWRESRKKVDELILIHLPAGPTAIFKVSDIRLNQDIYHHGNPTDHFPELILNNFNSVIGRRIGRFFASLFPQEPEFKGRRVCTFHNQRDFIFFRHHRYIFGDEGERASLQEIGPRFTLQLRKLEKGVFDNTLGEIEFQAKDDMYVSRKKFYL